MTTRKVILWSLVIPLSLLILLYIILRGNVSFSDALPGVILVFGIWGIGLFVGLILYAVFFKATKSNPWHYMYGQAIVWGGIVIYMAVWTIYSRNRSGKITNIEHNHSMVNLDTTALDSYELPVGNHVKIAFKKFESAFNDHNSFHLDSWLTDSRDTIISSHPITTHTIYFIYTIKNSSPLIAKIFVLENEASIEVLNGGHTTFDEYALLRENNDRFIKNTLDSVRIAIDHMPDTMADREKAKEILDDVEKR